MEHPGKKKKKMMTTMNILMKLTMYQDQQVGLLEEVQ
jgi:hypothetical protein